MRTYNKKLQKIGNSRAVVLPEEFTANMDLFKDERVYLFVDAVGVVTIIRAGIIEEIQKKEVSKNATGTNWVRGA